mgnify:CR=1 FL=1
MNMNTNVLTKEPEILTDKEKQILQENTIITNK